MLGLENSEEVLQILDRYTKLKLKAIPQELEDYLGYVAKTGDPVYNWSTVRYLFREKLTNVIKDFHDTTPSIEDLPQCPNVDAFSYENLKTALIERLDMFHAAPFTLQRLCELLTDPKKHYCRLDKYMRALEKNILVVSTIEPGRKQAGSENGDSMPADIMLDSDVEKDMTGMSDSPKSFNEDTAAATVSAPVATASSSVTPKETENGADDDEDIDTDLPCDVTVAAPATDVTDEEPNLEIASEPKDETKLIDVEGSSEMHDDEQSAVESSLDAEPHIDVVDDIKEKETSVVVPNGVEEPAKPENVSIAEPALEQPTTEQIEALAVTPDEVHQSIVAETAKDIDMETEIVSEPMTDVVTADELVSPINVEVAVDKTESTPQSEPTVPVDDVQLEEENDTIFEPISPKQPRLDIAPDSTDSHEAPTESNEMKTAPIEEPTPAVEEPTETKSAEESAPIVEEPESSSVEQPSITSPNDAIQITEMAESDKSEFPLINSEPVIDEPDTIVTPQTIKETDEGEVTPTSVSDGTCGANDALTPVAPEISDAVLITETAVSPAVDAGTPLIDVVPPAVAVFPIETIQTPEAPEKTEEMAVEEVDATGVISTAVTAASDAAMDAAPIIPLPEVAIVAEAVVDAAVVNVHAEATVDAVVSATVAATEDEQMDVDETNSTDPMDL